MLGARRGWEFCRPGQLGGLGNMDFICYSINVLGGCSCQSPGEAYQASSSVQKHFSVQVWQKVAPCPCLSEQVASSMCSKRVGH